MQSEERKQDQIAQEQLVETFLECEKIQTES